MQTSISEHNRGTVFGVQNSLLALFELLKDLPTIFLPNPKTFGLLIIASFITVGIGFALQVYAIFKVS